MLVLDAGVLIALDRGRDDVASLVAKRRHRDGAVLTHGGIIGQAWRGGSRQARLARWLRGFTVVALDQALGRGAGELLARTGSSDVIDAALVVIAADGDEIVTTDNDDFAALIDATGKRIGLSFI